MSAGDGVEKLVDASDVGFWLDGVGIAEALPLQLVKAKVKASKYWAFRSIIADFT